MPVERYWYSLNAVALLLWPLGWLFAAVVTLRRIAYRRGICKSYQAEAPVVIVGNISVGGTGKTPLVIGLVEVLRKNGYRPGIVSRGYGGRRSQAQPCIVHADSEPKDVGDEPVLLARRCHCPLVVSSDRVAAVRYLLAHYDCNVILSDDGLQHYALARDIEIVVVDGVRRFGNGASLPAGPLRELPGRLQCVDFVVVNGIAKEGEFLMTLSGGFAVSLDNEHVIRDLAMFAGSVAHAVAGIGNPGRFFDDLERCGIRVLPHAFPDHHVFTDKELDFDDCLPVLMTEKDAVKCHGLAPGRYWYVPVWAELSAEFEHKFLQQLACCMTERGLAEVR